MSSCEAEFMAAIVVACQAIWLNSLLCEMLKTSSTTIDLLLIISQFHFICECIERKHTNVNYVRYFHKITRKGEIFRIARVNWCQRFDKANPRLGGDRWK